MNTITQYTEHRNRAHKHTVHTDTQHTDTQHTNTLYTHCTQTDRKHRYTVHMQIDSQCKQKHTTLQTSDIHLETAYTQTHPAHKVLAHTFKDKLNKHTDSMCTETLHAYKHHTYMLYTHTFCTHRHIAHIDTLYIHTIALRVGVGGSVTRLAGARGHSALGVQDTLCVWSGTGSAYCLVCE